MPELEDSSGLVRRDEAHERWLAMQSAYAEYVRASEVFENSREMARDSADLGHCDLTLLDCRRDAFERYLETRIEYLERRYDEGYRREAAMVSPPTRETGGLRTISWLTGPKWPIIPVLVVGIFSVTVFSFVREQKHVRDLDSARDQLRASLSDTREELKLLAKELDAWETTERSAVRQVEHKTQPPVPAPQVDGRKPSGETRRRLAERSLKTASRGVAARGYFSLSHSSQFKRLGPIKVSLKSVDRRRNSVDVSIVSESGRVDVQHLRVNQPVRIKRGYREQPMELVVDRITANGVSGHLIEFHG
jgi:hypothetical protein